MLLGGTELHPSPHTPPPAADFRSGGAEGHPPGTVPGGSSRYTL